MRDVILLVSPAPPTSSLGNGVTAQRWERILREQGFSVVTAERYQPGDYVALIALHARKSAAAIQAFSAEHPGRPVVLALTGTDLYPDLVSTGVDPDILRLADALVVLQPRGLDQLDARLRAKAHVIVQSMPAVEPAPLNADTFDVTVLAHLRAVKDPLCAAAATRLLPAESRVSVRHAGAALDPALGEAARAEDADNSRYTWLGDLRREDALRLLAGSRLLVVTSRHEGGANVISEALAAGVPVVSSAIPGSQGLLGADYPGYFPVGDAAALADLLRAAETDRDGLYSELRDRCEQLRELVEPDRERQAWARVLGELSLGR